MKYSSGPWAAFILCCMLFPSCGNYSGESKNTVTKKDSDTVKLLAATKNRPEKISGNYDRMYNDIGRYLAGMPPEAGAKLDSSFIKNKDWKLYAEGAEKKWHEYDSVRIEVLKKWSGKELKNVNTEGSKLFYPFSGPDILHGNCFFYNADTTVMIGLEPVGSVPFLKKNEKDTIGNYFHAVNNSLFTILNLSFFKTASMKKQLRTEVNGTVPIMMIFLERTGNRVLDVQPVHIDSSGKVVRDEPGHQGYKIPGVEITYCRSDSMHPAHVFYYSTDISNGGFTNHPQFSIYLRSLGKVNTYLKSASYLMHKAFFSGIRDIILAQSEHVLQDDSGIPNRFFNPAQWSHILYGEYTGVIPLFKGFNQRDLDSLFATEHSSKKPLGFGIGYKWHIGESNLVLYSKKSPTQ